MKLKQSKAWYKSNAIKQEDIESKWIISSIGVAVASKLLHLALNIIMSVLSAMVQKNSDDIDDDWSENDENNFAIFFISSRAELSWPALKSILTAVRS